MVFFFGGECRFYFYGHGDFSEQFLGNENSARSFSDRSFFKTLPGVMDVRAFGSWMSAPKCLFLTGCRGPDRSFCPRTSAGISAWTSTGYPAPKRPKTYSLGCFFVPEFHDACASTSDPGRNVLARKQLWGALLAISNAAPN